MQITQATEKPVVHFSGAATFWGWELADGTAEVASVYALDHPRLGQQVVRTSEVIKKFDDGSFETLNTIYKPEAA